MKTARKIELLAEALDSKGRADAPITVMGTRGYLLRWFKPQKPGQPLLCRSHELQVVPRPPKPKELESLDWVDARAQP